MQTNNIVQLHPQHRPRAVELYPMTRENRIRIARYETKKLAREINPGTVFNLDIIYG
jgi:hypothetical protein